MGKLGKKPVSSRKHEDTDEAAGFLPPPASSHFYIQNDSSHLLTFTCCSAEPALRTSSGWNLERFEAFFIQQQKTLPILTLFHLKKKAGLQAQGSRHMLRGPSVWSLGSYTWCLCRNSCLHNSEAIPPKLSFAKLTKTKRLKTTEYWNSTLQVSKGWWDHKPQHI